MQTNDQINREVLRSRFLEKVNYEEQELSLKKEVVSEKWSGTEELRNQKVSLPRINYNI